MLNRAKIFHISEDNLSSLSDISGTVVALGNFDGVHQGHMKVLKQAKKLASDIGSKNWSVILLNPHPLVFFSAKTDYLINNLQTNIEILSTLGVPNIIVLDFKVFCNFSRDEFLYKVLDKALGVKGIVTGEDFTFGANKSGNINTLKEFSQKHGIFYDCISNVCIDDVVCSSSFIRELIQKGDINKANKFLGRNYFLSSEVVHGNALARELDCPTANLILDEATVKPKHGVYMVRALVEDERTYLPAIANFGLRPTFAKDIYKNKPILEVHIFNYHADLYGQNFGVEFIDYIRDEIKFDGIESLKNQISLDFEQAKNYFNIF